MITRFSRSTANSMTATYERCAKWIHAHNHVFTHFCRGVTFPRGMDRRR